MSRPPKPVEAITTEIREAIVASPKRQRRLRSSTLWRKYRVRKRTAGRVAEVAEQLRAANILITMADGVRFGSERPSEWIILSAMDPAEPTPPEPRADEDRRSDSWVADLPFKQYDSEQEVVLFFVVPLLYQLGYEEADLQVGRRVEVYQGVKKVRATADLVVCDGRAGRPDDALLVVETKAAGHLLKTDDAFQARTYAMWLNAPYYLVTNGFDIQLFLFRGAAVQDVRLESMHVRDFSVGGVERLGHYINPASIRERKAIMAKAHSILSDNEPRASV